MQNYMNEPEDKSWTNEDIKTDYGLYKDIKLVEDIRLQHQKYEKY